MSGWVKSSNLTMVFGVVLGTHLGFTVLALVPAMEELRSLYQVSYTSLSVLISAIFWSHTAVQVPAGVLADKLGVRPSIYLGLALVAAGSLMPAAGPWFWLALLGRVVAGMGTGLAFTAGMKQLAFSGGNGPRGLGQAVLGACVSFGGMVAYLLIPPVSGLWGWEVVYWVPAALCLPVAALLLAVPPATESGGEPPLPFWKMMHQKRAWILGLYHAMAYGAMMNLGNWVPTLFSEVWQQQSAMYLALGGAMSLFISGLGRLGGGVVLERIAPLTMCHVSVILLTVAFAVIPFSGGGVWLLGAVMAGAFLSSINFGAVFQLATDKIPAASASSMIGLVNFLGNVGAILFTLCFGVMKDLTGSVAWGFLPLAALGVLTLAGGLSTLGLRER